ncbi:MAG: hypothetical protein RL596_2213 [Bacteroidota bacterium]|jgi:hypothetical protein
MPDISGITMESIPKYFDNVKRTAMLLKPKQPFFDWLKSIDPNDEPNELMKEGNVFLLPDYDEVKQMENWLKKNFDDIFSDQLNNWYIDEELWPKNRTLKMFKEWFYYSLHTMVWDTEDKFIEKV